MPSTDFKVLLDEHIASAVAIQLINKGVDATRLIDVLSAGTSDPEVLEYAYTEGYAIVTLDKNMMEHIMARMSHGKEHHGVFIGINIQGKSHIGVIVNFIQSYHEAIIGGAASVDNDIYNQIIYFP